MAKFGSMLLFLFAKFSGRQEVLALKGPGKMREVVKSYFKGKFQKAPVG